MKQHDYAAFLSLKEQWPVTPATSDLFTTSLVVLEMHARNAPWLGPGSVSPLEAVQKCVTRTPLTKVRTMDPAAAEQWIIAQLGNDKLAGKIESAGIDGAQLLEIAEMKQKDAGVALGVKMALAKAPQLAVRRSVSTPSDTMHQKIATLLLRSLAKDVGERPASAFVALKALGVKFQKNNSTTNKMEPSNCLAAPGGESLPHAALKQATEHTDESIATTLGGLTKALVLHGAVPAGLAACAEWLGASSSETARAAATDAYINFWKRHGSELRSLELSRYQHGHWRDEMLSGGDGAFVRRLVPALLHCGARLEEIDLSQQPELEGPVLKILFSDSALTTVRNLHTLKLSKCQKVTDAIPITIGECTMLRRLDLTKCGISGGPIAHG